MSESATAPAAPAASAGASDEERAHAVGRLRRSSLGQVILLLIQAALGMAVNIYVSVPTADQGKGQMAAFGEAISNGPVSLAIHAVLGILLFINSIVLIFFAFTVRSVVARVCSIIGLLTIIGAAMSGAAFVNANHAAGNGASFTMALLTFVALACYMVNLYVLGSRNKA